LHEVCLHTFNGAGFVSASVVNWNGGPLSTSFVSANKLEADLPASHLVSADTAYVTVSNPAPGGGTSNSVRFTITKPTTSVTFVPRMHAVGLTPARAWSWRTSTAMASPIWLSSALLLRVAAQPAAPFQPFWETATQLGVSTLASLTCRGLSEDDPRYAP
jgi:hypothetical protein